MPCGYCTSTTLTTPCPVCVAPMSWDAARVILASQRKRAPRSTSRTARTSRRARATTPRQGAPVAAPTAPAVPVCGAQHPKIFTLTCNLHAGHGSVHLSIGGSAWKDAAPAAPVAPVAPARCGVRLVSKGMTQCQRDDGHPGECSFSGAPTVSQPRPAGGAARPAPVREGDLPAYPAPAPAPAPTPRPVPMPETPPPAALAPLQANETPRVTRWDSMRPPERTAALSALREAFRTGKILVGIMRAVHLADEGAAQSRALLLTEIDARAARLGRLSAEDESARWEVLAAVVEELGFDPRVEDRAHPGGNVVAFPAPVSRGELGDGALSPLVGGDWAGLWMRVQNGHLTQRQAEEIGAIWRAHGA